MATKKQKRAAALAKREAYMAEVKADGLRALEASRKRQAERRLLAIQTVREISEHYQQILDNATPAERARTQKAIDRQPKQTSFYSEKQGRPVNAATYYAEQR